MLSCLRRVSAVSGLLLLLAAGVGIVPARAMDPQKHDEIRALLEATHSLEAGRVMMQQMMPALLDTLKKAHPEIPQSFLDDVSRITVDEATKELPALEEPIIAIYDHSFSDQEIRDLLAFYRSPLGEKMVEQMPSIIQHSVAAAKAWNAAMMPKILKRIQDRAKEQGYKL